MITKRGSHDGFDVLNYSDTHKDPDTRHCQIGRSIVNTIVDLGFLIEINICKVGSDVSPFFIRFGQPRYSRNRCEIDLSTKNHRYRVNYQKYKERHKRNREPQIVETTLCLHISTVIQVLKGNGRLGRIVRYNNFNISSYLYLSFDEFDLGVLSRNLFEFRVVVIRKG